MIPLLDEMHADMLARLKQHWTFCAGENPPEHMFNSIVSWLSNQYSTNYRIGIATDECFHFLK